MQADSATETEEWIDTLRRAHILFQRSRPSLGKEKEEGFSEEEEDREDKVTLSTLHGSKGLEFGTVWFLGCDEGIIPHSRTDNPKATDVLSTIDATEERRLFYVGVTRAKEQLYLVRAKVRSGRGAARATAPSRFLKFPPLPPGTLETVQYDSQAPLAPQEIAAQARAFREALMALKTPRG